MHILTTTLNPTATIKLRNECFMNYLAVEQGAVSIREQEHEH